MRSTGKIDAHQNNNLTRPVLHLYFRQIDSTTRHIENELFPFVRRFVTVHALGRSDGVLSPAQWAWMA